MYLYCFGVRGQEECLELILRKKIERIQLNADDISNHDPDKTIIGAAVENNCGIRLENFYLRNF